MLRIFWAMKTREQKSYTFNYEAMRSDPNTLIVSDAGRDLYQV